MQAGGDRQHLPLPATNSESPVNTAGTASALLSLAEQK